MGYYSAIEINYWYIYIYILQYGWILALESGDGLHNIMKILNATELYTLQMVKNGKFSVIYVLPQFKKYYQSS